jgi:hypothetical protein
VGPLLNVWTDVLNNKWKDKQHSVLSELMGSKYPTPMLEVMAEEPGVTKACLDLGCGSGNW